MRLDRRQRGRARRLRRGMVGVCTLAALVLMFVVQGSAVRAEPVQPAAVEKPAAPDSAEKARVLSAQGADAMAAGDAQTALTAFLEADRLAPSPRTRYNVATAHQSLGHLVEAVRFFKAFLADSGDVTEVYRKDAAAQLAELEPRVGQLAVRGAAGTELVWDGADRLVLPLKAPWVGEAGPHVLLVRRSGGTTDRHDVTLVAGKVTEVTIAASALAGPLVTPAGQDEGKNEGNDEKKIWSRWWFWSAVGAVVVLGVVVGVATRSPEDASCTSGAACMRF